MALSSRLPDPPLVGSTGVPASTGVRAKPQTTGHSSVRSGTQRPTEGLQNDGTPASFAQSEWLLHDPSALASRDEASTGPADESRDSIGPSVETVDESGDASAATPPAAG